MICRFIHLSLRCSDLNLDFFAVRAETVQLLALLLAFGFEGLAHDEALALDLIIEVALVQLLLH